MAECGRVKNHPLPPLITTAALGVVWYGLVVFNMFTERHSLYRGLNPDWMLPALVFLPLLLLVAGTRLVPDLPRRLGWQQGLWLLLIMGPPMLGVAVPLSLLVLPMVIANGWMKAMDVGTLFAVLLALAWLLLLAWTCLTLRRPAPGKTAATLFLLAMACLAVRRPAPERPAAISGPPAEERPGWSRQDQEK